MPAPVSIVDFSVELPAGGPLHLQSADEVDLWTRSLARYRDEYVLSKVNDLVSLGTLLQQQIVVFRCQTAINGMEPELDGRGVPTGSYKRVEMDGGELASYGRALLEASKEMRALEKALGIDKQTREAGGAHTLSNYIAVLKRAAHDRGIHISKRTLEYERFVNELRWKVRMLYHADKEDRAYHDITPKSVLDWIVGEVVVLDKIDTDYAREKGKLYIGEL